MSIRFLNTAYLYLGIQLEIQQTDGTLEVKADFV